ncbi:hypothetical protein PM082_000186 [Marasmius tenuissimus]|nr:hypothetical protein PM082_000186 [Marasmius tenuissimus]
MDDGGATARPSSDSKPKTPIVLCSRSPTTVFCSASQSATVTPLHSTPLKSLVAVQIGTLPNYAGSSG